MCMLAALPMEVYLMWVQYPWPWGEAACRLRAMMPELVAHVSVLTILAVSGERYVAITNPVYARTTHTLARTARVVPVIWLLSLVAAVPWGYYYQVRFPHLVVFPSVLTYLFIFCSYHRAVQGAIIWKIRLRSMCLWEWGCRQVLIRDNQSLFSRTLVQVNQLQDPAGVDLPESSWCSIPYQDKESRWSWLIWLSTVGAFILPMTILIFLYCRIGLYNTCIMPQNCFFMVFMITVYGKFLVSR